MQRILGTDMHRLYLTIVFLISVIGSAHAQNLQINIHGTPFTCTAFNGQTVPIFTGPAAAQAATQLGGARVDLIPGKGYMMAINTVMLSQTPPLSAVFVFFHECGHAALHPAQGLQSPHAQFNADCWAIKQMVQWGYVQNWSDFEQAVTYLVQIGGLHGITQARIQKIAACT